MVTSEAAVHERVLRETLRLVAEMPFVDREVGQMVVCHNRSKRDEAKSIQPVSACGARSTLRDQVGRNCPSEGVEQ